MMRWLKPDDPRRKMWERCESPIEQIICVTLFADLGLEALDGDFSKERLPEMMRFPQPAAFLWGQQWLTRFRVDFLVTISDAFGCCDLFAIECDGKAYHSSLEQIAYDQRRDEVLRKAGCREVLRFRGKDIVSNPRLVANNLYSAIDRHGVAPKEGEGCGWYCSMFEHLRMPEARPRLSLEEIEREEALAAIRAEDAKWM